MMDCNRSNGKRHIWGQKCGSTAISKKKYGKKIGKMRT